MSAKKLASARSTVLRDIHAKDDRPARVRAIEPSTRMLKYRFPANTEDEGMTKHPRKKDFPVGEIRRYLEPGPIVLVSSRWRDKTNIMTMGWHTVMEFTPALVGCIIAGSNHSFGLIRRS